MAKIKKSYDALIVGGGLSGLLAAKVLAKKNKSFLIIEPSERLGGRLLGWNAQDQVLPSNLNLYSQSEEHLARFTWLEEALDQKIVDGSYQTSAVHFQDGAFKSFNGFGDRSPEAINQLNKFCFDNEKIKLDSFPQDWISQLTSSLSEDEFATHSEVTKVNFVDGKAVSAELNGKTTVEFENIIWAIAPHKMLNAISPEILASETKKLKRQEGVFDAVILNLAHKDFDFAETNLDSIFCLYGSSQEFEPIIGTVSKDYSCWMTLIDSDKTLDHEYVSKVIKNMKKQIKRGFPTLLDAPELKEKIIVSESSYGQVSLKETDQGFLKSIPNLFCASSLCSSTDGGLVGSIERAQVLENAL